MSIPRRILTFVRKHWRAAIGAVLAVSFIGLNALSYSHARSMTHFVADGAKTRSPAHLTVWQKGWTLLTGVNVPRPRNASSPADRGLDYLTVEFLTTDGVPIEAWFVDRLETHDVVVLFHGYSAAKGSLLGEARTFHDLGYDVLMVDFRGSGGSGGSETSLGWHEALEVQAAVEYLRDRHAPKRVFLYGMSMGAAAVLRAMDVADLDVDALVLESPFNSMLDTTTNRFHQMGLPGFPCAHLLLFWGGWQCGFDAFSHTPQDYIRRVECPVLLLFGALDLEVRPADAQQIIHNAGIDASHCIFDNGSHSALRQSNTARWNQEVGDFLQRVVRSTNRR